MSGEFKVIALLLCIGWTAPVLAEFEQSSILGVGLMAPGEGTTSSPPPAFRNQMSWMPPSVDLAVTIDLVAARRAVVPEGLTRLVTSWIEVSDQDLLGHIGRLTLASTLGNTSEMEALALLETDLEPALLAKRVAELSGTAVDPGIRTRKVGERTVSDLMTVGGLELSVLTPVPGLVMFSYHPPGISKLLHAALHGEGNQAGNWMVDGDVALDPRAMMSVRVFSPRKLDRLAFLQGKGWENFDALSSDLFADGDRHVLKVNCKLNSLTTWWFAEGRINKAIQEFASDPVNQRLPPRLLEIVRAFQFRTQGMALVATLDILSSDLDVVLDHFSLRAKPR